MTKPNKKKKKSVLAAAASKKLATIGAPKMSAEEVAHALLHAEESGDVKRVDLDDGSWGWAMRGPDGKTRVIKPTPEMLEALERFEREGHPGH
jgi:hypothetical protein